jgi:hypothetical protein
MMPSGHIWVPGGTWAQKPNGTWPKAAGADMYAPYADYVRQVALNKRLWDASIGNWWGGGGLGGAAGAAGVGCGWPGLGSRAGWGWQVRAPVANP